MKLLKITIAGYLIGLFTFYLCATFNTLAWDIVYFGWSKIFDAGVLFWAVLYFSGGEAVRDLVKRVFVFSFIRLVADIQYWFTGISVNNERLVAVLFLIIVSLTGYLCFRPESHAAKWLNKHLFKSD